MKKLLGVLLLWVSFWFVGLTTVHAETQPLPPDYDPIQGGMVFRPPKDLWVKENSFTVIPIAYLPGGPLNTAQLSQASYHVMVNGKEAPIQPINLSNDVDLEPSSEVSFGAIRVGGLGIFVRTTHAGDYAIKIVMTLNQQTNSFETDMVLHVSTQISEITWADTSFKPILSPLPQLVLWHHLDGEVTIEIGTTTTSANAFNWPTISAFYLIPPGSTSTNNLSSMQRQLIVTGGVATQQFGLLPITLTSGQPLVLDFDYIKPNPGTKLEFVWEFHQTNSSNIMPDIITDTPTLSADQVQKASGSLQLILRYSNAESVIEYRSSVISYVYQSTQLTTKWSLPSAKTTVSLPAIMQGRVTVNAGLTDLQVSLSSAWRFNISVSALKQADGTILQAGLKWPNGTMITPTQPYSIAYPDKQVLLPLSQIDWVFQQQPLAKAGQYQAEIQIQAIAGP